MLHLQPQRPAVFLGGVPTSLLWLGIGSEAEADTAARWAAGRFVLECLEQGQSVLLHSGEGRHRVRWAYVAYLICSGKPTAAALRAAESPPWLAPYHTMASGWDSFAGFVRSRAESVATPLSPP